MFKIAICDNDQNDLNLLHHCIQAYFKDHPECHGQLYQYNHPKDLLEDVDKEDFFVYFLDILMPDMDGIELARKIRENHQKRFIVFTTSTREFAFQAFEIHAFHYLEKPLTREAVDQVLDLVFEFYEGYQNSQICINGKDGITSVRIDDIVYVENISRSAVYTLIDGTTITGVCNRGSFENSVQELKEHSDFVQPHKSFFVNMRYIRTLRAEELTMDNGKEISISRRKASETKKAYLKFLSGGGERF